MYAKTVGALDIDMQVDSLVMLTSIENRLEELIEQEELLQGGAVREAQKELEKLRRQHAREEKQRQVEKKHKERAQRAKERSNQVFQKVPSPSAGLGRPIQRNPIHNFLLSADENWFQGRDHIIRKSKKRSNSLSMNLKEIENFLNTHNFSRIKFYLTFYFFPIINK